MGNVNQGDRFKGDDGMNELGLAALRSWPILFHATHSATIRVSHDRRRAKRTEGIKGVCFSSRPVCIGERVYVRITDASALRVGALRFGFTTDDPCTIDASELPRYAFPDLTNEDGYWAKAVPENVATRGTTLFFYIAVGTGDVMYGYNGDEVGIFFSGIQTSNPLWALLDLYGSTTAVEFIDGEQILPSGSYISIAGAPLHHEHGLPFDPPYYMLPAVCPAGARHSPTPSLPALSSTPPPAAPLSAPFHPPVDILDPMPFHQVCGRNIALSFDRTTATRIPDEYCNGYVFTCRAVRPGERLVLTVGAVEREYVGGFAFGVTSCDPARLGVHELPDDSDLLLDRPEYWVVHKDVCIKPDIGDQLSFTLTTSGEVRYSRNGHSVATLMHVDTSLPLWAFCDIYGSTKEIKSGGVVITPLVVRSSHANTHCHHSNLSNTAGSNVSLANLRLASEPRLGSLTASDGSVGGRSQSPSHRLRHHCHSFSSTVDSSTPSPDIQTTRQVIIRPAYDVASPKRLLSPDILAPSKAMPIDAPVDQLPLLPPPLIPIPAGRQLQQQQPSTKLQTPTRPKLQSTRKSMPAAGPPPIPTRRSLGNVRDSFPPLLPMSTATPSPTLTVTEAENFGTRKPDAPSSECAVCLESAPDCVLYTCGHMCMCYACAVDVVRNRGALCPICRQPIRDVIKIFRS